MELSVDAENEAVPGGGISGKWAVFGGSFDPVHLGHLGLTRAAKEEAGLDGVIFMPCFVSPFKSGEGTVATPGQRAEMLRIAMEDLDGEWARLSTYELERTRPSYSWETAAFLSGRFPEVDWHWIVGTDQWEAIERWAEPDTLRRLLHFVVVTREGVVVRERDGWRCTPVNFSHPASSTAIRADFFAHGDWLPPGVAQYCREQGLYRDGSDVRRK